MDANELRIGNHTNFGIVYQIESECFYVKKEDVSYKSTWAVIQPIPLTPEILEKCGFKYGIVEGVTTIKDSYNDKDEDGDTEYWDKGKLTIVNWGKKEFILSHKSSFDHRIEIKSLHQLQNLYYSLTGTELEIKL